jgi:hypothetical protein
MADIGDVANALVALCGTALYPAGVGAGSPVGLNFRIYRGHPTPKVLDEDIVAGFAIVGGAYQLVTPGARIAHVCVNPRPGVGRAAKSYVFNAPTSTPASATLTAVVAGDTVTLGGTIAAGQGMAVDANGIAAGAAAGSADTLATLATLVAAALTSAGATASAAGPVITVPGAPSGTLYANGFVLVATGQEVRRQIQGFDITIYAPGRDARDAISAAISPALGAVTRVVMPDGFQAKIDPASPIELDDDRPEKELLFVRKLFYAVEYATVLSGAAATLAIGQVNFAQQQTGAAIASVTET